MKMWGHFRMAVGVFAFTVLSVMYLLTYEQNRRAFNGLQGKLFLAIMPTDEDDRYLVNGEHCRIRNMDPFDKSILPYIEPTTPVICSVKPPLSSVIKRNGSNVLVIDQSLSKQYKLYNKHRIECCYSIINRISQTLEKYNENADKNYKIESCININQQQILKNTTQFLIVKCQSIPFKKKQGKIVYENAHAIIPLLPKLDKKLKAKILQNNSNNAISNERLNVMIIAIDSISRLSLRRTMPKTLEYLKSNEWVEMDGYNKIADNTLPNVMAILSGRTMEQLYKECYREKTPIMDHCPNIWKEFQKENYVTAYAEDIPLLSTFNYRMTGFVEQPTDYYMRPFMLAAHAKLPYRNKDGLPICIGPESAAHHIFKYAKDFATTFQNNNFFGLFWLNSFSHNNVNSPGALDLRLLNLLKGLEDTGVYNNTLVLLLSDHGIRFGDIRKTFLGFLEERLPFIFLRLPKNITQRYPDSYKNLITNKNRLTSPFDVHATLKQVLYDDFEPPTSCPTCRSLFSEVPRNRSCIEAGIDPHWCTCPNFEEIALNNTEIVNIADFLIQRIYNRTRDVIISEKADATKCQERVFEKFIRVHRSEDYGSEGKDRNVYVVVMETNPFGLFEATIQVDYGQFGPEYQVLGFISRLDSYFTTSKCVTSKMLQFYCHCNNVIT